MGVGEIAGTLAACATVATALGLLFRWATRGVVRDEFDAFAEKKIQPLIDAGAEFHQCVDRRFTETGAAIADVKLDVAGVKGQIEEMRRR